jgi:hypothetical protein
LRRSP